MRRLGSRLALKTRSKQQQLQQDPSLVGEDDDIEQLDDWEGDSEIMATARPANGRVLTQASGDTAVRARRGSIHGRSGIPASRAQVSAV